MALSEEEKLKIKERLERIGRLSEEDRPKLTRKQKSLIEEESERINSYNAMSRANSDDFLDTSLPLYLINRLNDAGLTTTGDFGFYMDYCKNNGILTTDDIDKLLDRIPESKMALESARGNLEKTKSREYLSHNVESIFDSIKKVEELVKDNNKEKKYNPYTDITGESGLTGFDTDIRALKNIINTKAFDKDLEADIERREKSLEDLKNAIDKEYHEIKKLNSNNIKEISAHATKYNELTRGYHNAKSVLEKLTKQRERTSLLSFDDINRAQSLSDHIYNSLNFAKVYGFSSSELSDLNGCFDKLNNDFVMYRELIVNASNLEKEVNKKDNELNKLFASLMVSVNGNVLSENNIEKDEKIEHQDTLVNHDEVEPVNNPEEKHNLESNHEKSEITSTPLEDKKVIFIGFDNKDNPLDYKDLELGEEYIVQNESLDSYSFKNLNDNLPKSSFMSEEEFNNMYAPGKKVYLYVPKENADLIDDELELNRAYTIKSIDNDKITFNELNGTYPKMTFVIPETWNYIGYSLTGLKTNDPKFKDALNNMYYGNEPKKKEKEEPIKPQASESSLLLPPHEDSNDEFYIVYQGNAPKGFEEYYSRLTKGQKYKVINETESYYEIELDDNTPFKVLKSYACTLKEWQDRDNLVVYNGKLIKDEVCSIKDYVDLVIGKKYKVKYQTADGKYLVLEGFEDKKIPTSVFTSLKKWESLTEEERVNIRRTPRAHKVIKEETKNRAIYLSSFAVAIVSLIAGSVPLGAATISVLFGAGLGAFVYYIDKLKKQGKHEERKKSVRTLKDKLREIFIDTDKEHDRNNQIRDSLAGIIDNDLKGELIEEGLDENIFEDGSNKIDNESKLSM